MKEQKVIVNFTASESVVFISLKRKYNEIVKFLKTDSMIIK